MICISINQESRRLALADMLNAGRLGDLLEIRIDRFGKAPDLKELLTARPKPVIMTCRRIQDGGNWEGSEDERLALLRQCIIDKTDYVEIELDVADQVRRFPPSQRVIAYTNLRETPPDILDIYDEALTKSPDVVKLVTLTRTPEEAWPLVQIVAKQRVPTVVVGLGKPGIMLSLLGKKIGAPWTYAALEQGMEAYPGQATIRDLRQIYHYDSIDRKKRFIGVTGFGPREVATVALFNAALAHLDLPARCLPLAVGDAQVLRKVMEAAKVAGVAVDFEHQEALAGIVSELHGGARRGQVADFLIHKGDAWHGFDVLNKVLVGKLEKLLEPRYGVEPLRGRMVMLAGINARARCLAAEIQNKGGNVIFASHQRKAAQALAQSLGCRFVQFEALYTTLHDIIIVCGEEKDDAGRIVPIHAGYLKPGMAVADLSAAVKRSPFLRQAAERECLVVDPKDLLVDVVQNQMALLSDRSVPVEVLSQAIPERVLEET
jgi:3-dehydroquinate dehydratase/shikimate dehydrogenase